MLTFASLIVFFSFFIAAFRANAGVVSPRSASVIDTPPAMVSVLATPLVNGMQDNTTSLVRTPVGDSMADLEAGYYGTAPNTAAADALVFNCQELDNCITQCGINHTSDSSLVLGNPAMPDDAGAITISVCTRAMVQCNSGCLIEYFKDMTTWHQSDETDNNIRKVFSNTLPTCINGCNRDSTNDAQSIDNLGVKGNPLTVTFGMCNSKLSKCNGACQNEFNQEIVEERKKQRDSD